MRFAGQMNCVTIINVFSEPELTQLYLEVFCMVILKHCQFTERTNTDVFLFYELTFEPGGAVRPRNAYTALSSLASKKAS